MMLVADLGHHTALQQTPPERLMSLQKKGKPKLTPNLQWL